jgi:hypothetical protein
MGGIAMLGNTSARIQGIHDLSLVQVSAFNITLALGIQVVATFDSLFQSERSPCNEKRWFRTQSVTGKNHSGRRWNCQRGR